MSVNTAPPRVATQRPSELPIPRARNRAARALWITVTALFAVFFVLPVIWLLLATTKTNDEIIRRNPFAVGSFGHLRQAWHNLYAFQDGVILHWLGNSALYVLLAMVITLVTGIPAGYAMAVLEFRGRKLLLTLTLLVMLMPAATLVLPLYLEMDAVHLTGTIWSVVLPFSFFPSGST